MVCNKFSLLLFMIIAWDIAISTASRQGGKLQLQDSSDLEEENDQRPGNGFGRGRNQRGRGRGNEKHLNIPEFEEALPGVYPIKGPAQRPVVFPSSNENGLAQAKPVQTQPSVQSPTFGGNVFATHNNNQAQFQQLQQQQQVPENNPYAGNPFLTKLQNPSTIPTNKYNPPTQGVTNQLPTSDKPAATTSSYENPRRTDLLYGSNLFEETTTRVGKSSDDNEVNFDDRGLFDTAPHCKDGEILVGNRCRMAV